MPRDLILSTDRSHDGSPFARRRAHRNRPLQLHRVFADKKERIYLSGPVEHGGHLFHFAYRRRFQPAYDRRFPRSYRHDLLLLCPGLVGKVDRARLQPLLGLTAEDWLLDVRHTCLALLRHGYAHELFDTVTVDPSTGHDRCMRQLLCCDLAAVLGDLDGAVTDYGETGRDRLCARSLESILLRKPAGGDDETKGWTHDTERAL